MPRRLTQPLALTLALGVTICASCDDPSSPNEPLDTRVPEYRSQWEADTWSFTTDDGGHVHVTQFWNLDVMTYSSDGDSLGNWFVIFGNDTLSTNGLTHVGETFVALSSSRVFVIDKNYAVVNSWPETRHRSVSGGGDLIDADAAGDIYVLDDNRDLVVKYGIDGEFKREWRIENSDSQGAGGVAGIAVADAGLVFVSDSWRHRILVYTTDGEFVREFGKRGNSPGQFYAPRGLDVAGKVLYVADMINFRIQKLTLHGGYLSDFYSRGMYGQGLDPPESVDVDGASVFVMHENSIIRFEYVD